LSEARRRRATGGVEDAIERVCVDWIRGEVAHHLAAGDDVVELHLRNLRVTKVTTLRDRRNTGPRPVKFTLPV
jgi:hypothetical protein